MANDLFCLNLSIFGERLQDIIFDYNLSVPGLATLINVPKSTIYRYTTGKFLPSLKIALKLSQLFNCTLDYLFGIEEENRATNLTILSSFSKRLTELMETRKITVLHIEKNTGIDSRNIYYWLKNRQPTIENVYVLSRYFGCSMDYLIGRIS